MTARQPRRPARGLSAEGIRDAALALIDRDGLAAFSTHKLGHALGCKAMAIYWYYPHKEALLDAVVDALVAPIARLGRDDASDWVEVLRQIAHAYRGIAHDHPHAFPLLATRRFATAGTYAFLERIFTLAQGQGISDRDAARFYRIVSSYCSGFALNELAPPRQHSDAALHHAFTRVVAVSKWLEPRHLDAIFADGLELLLDALASAVSRAPAPRRRSRPRSLAAL